MTSIQNVFLKLSFVLFLLFTTSCTKAIPELFDLASGSLNPPSNGGNSNWNVTIYPWQTVATISGECGSKLKGIEVSIDNGTTWNNSSIFSSVDSDCSDGNFSFSISPISTYLTVTLLTSHNVLIRGISGASTTSSSVATVSMSNPSFTISGIHYGAIDAIVDDWLSYTTPQVTWSDIPLDHFTLEIIDSGTSAVVCSATSLTGTTYTFGVACALTNGTAYLARLTGYDINNVAYLADNNDFNFTVDTVAPTSITSPLAMKAMWSGGSAISAASWKLGKTMISTTTNFGFSSPQDISFDSSFFYVADSLLSHRIVKYDKVTGRPVGWIGKVSDTTDLNCLPYPNPIVNSPTPGWCTGGASTSGNTTGSFYNPSGVFVDEANDKIYVSDSTNNRIQRFNLTSGSSEGWIGRILSTTGMTCASGSPVSGSATPSWCSGGSAQPGDGDGMLNSPRKIVVSAGSLFVADYGNHRIQKFNLTSGTSEGWVGAVSITPTGGAVGCNSLITGQATPGWCFGGTAQASSGDGKYSSPAGIAADSTYIYTGNLATGLGSRISRINQNTGQYTGWVGKISSLTGITCESGTPAVGSITPSWCLGGGSVSDSIDGSYNLIYSLSADPINNAIFVVDANNYRVQRIQLSSGTYVGWLGRISIIDGTCNSGVGLFTGGWCSGTTSRSQAGVGDGMFNSPIAVAADAINNHIYVAESGSYRIQKFDLPSGNIIGAAGAEIYPEGWRITSQGHMGYQSGSLSNPNDVAIDTVNGVYYVADSGAHRIQKFNLVTGKQLGWIGFIGEPGGTCTNPAGTFTGGWCYGGKPFGTAQSGGFSNPRGIAIDILNNYLYVADSGNHRIQRFNLTSGAFAGWIGYASTPPASCVSGTPAVGVNPSWCFDGSPNMNSGLGGFSNPTGIAIGESNTLIIVDTNNHRIQKINFDGTFSGWLGKDSVSLNFTGAWVSTPVASATGNLDGMFNLPAKVAVDVANNHFFVTDKNNNRVQRFSLTTGNFEGWVGKVASVPSSCVSGSLPAINSVTPSWCFGGTASAGTSDGMYSVMGGGVAYDSTSDILYVGDASRIQKLNALNGSFLGWMGKIGSVTGLVCGVNSLNSFTDGWCSGGVSAYGSSNGMIYFASGIAIDSARNSILVSDSGNHRINKFIRPQDIDFTNPSIAPVFHSGTSFNFDWNIPSDSGSGLHLADTYQVATYSDLTCSGTPISNNYQTSNSINFSGMSSGGYYSVRVIAQDKAGNKSPPICSMPVIVDTVPPVGFSFTNPTSDTSVAISSYVFTWNYPTDSGGSGLNLAKTFKVEYFDRANCSGSPIDFFYTNNLSFHFTGFVPGNTYSIRLTANDEAGNTSAICSPNVSH